MPVAAASLAVSLRGGALTGIGTNNSEAKMENQHRKIKGYRELSQEEIDLMNMIKEQGIDMGSLITSLKANDELDQRWVAIGATHLQQGLMALTRAVAKPGFF